MNPKIRQNLFPVLAAFIWGTAFVAQSVSSDYIPPFTFNLLRSLVAAAVLGGGLAVYRRLLKAKRPQAVKPLARSSRDLLLGGLCCGTALGIAANLQQAGMAETSAGKAGFITALYIVLVPVLGLFLHKKAPATVWVGVVLAVAGLYFLCVNEALTLSRSDLLVMLCAFVFAGHILLVDHFTRTVDGVALSALQFVVAAVLSGLGAALWEAPTWEGIRQCVWPILYVGIFSSGVGYTLQILAQKDANPTVVSLLLSLESVFSVLAGAVILHDRLSGRELLGCGLMFLAVVLTQLPQRAPKVAQRP